ncbi:DUF1330 domain-containing protein [Polynucleobacter kasalickyi]|uniref:Uncharacterized conserved protein, DUF1330 family n=1 Tax=Polynucleobacter kasalickyi TaxID=1938817 RepID=A0A1W2C1S4_9BURK|nr:DUF1330 domain-containing protein [Polynucleobacter kasalickyi]SMC79185.1 Uncharacterized conserved protein, DUF1330 family [Polynucleobacter kasalickyi]
MSKVYWVSVYKSISDLDALAAYAKLASAAMTAHGGVFVARGNPVHIIEAGIQERVVLIEFESLEKALIAYNSDGYQAALKALGNTAVRDIRIIEAV